MKIYALTELEEMPESCAVCVFCPNWFNYKNKNDYVRNKCNIGAGHNCTDKGRHLRCPLRTEKEIKEEL